MLRPWIREIGAGTHREEAAPVLQRFMTKRKLTRRYVFVEAERIASDFPLVSRRRWEFFRPPDLKGVLSDHEIDLAIDRLRGLNVDDYIRQSVSPSENPKRKSAPEVIKLLGGRLITEVSDGPMYLAEMEFRSGERRRRLVFLAQNRKSANGVWMPQHHAKAADLLRFYSSYGMPVVTLIDTPGADAGEEANRQHQAHSISLLIAEMANLQLPSVGIVFGNGYSGGAIPLASTNVLLSVRDGVFNTIHPAGLAEIAYNYNLSWQECAKYIGVSSYELYRAGHLDGVIDYSPLDGDSPANLAQAIFTALDSVEDTAFRILADEEFEFFFQHYKESIGRYLHPSELLIEENRIADKTPTGMLNVFGSVYRFHRYLKLRLHLSSQSLVSYSHVDRQEPPEGQLHDRLERERQERFGKWLEHPLEIRYDDALSKRYGRFIDYHKMLGVQRSRITTFFVGHPAANLRRAVQDLSLELGLHLYNFWKVAARDNLVQLLEHLQRMAPAASPRAADHANLLDALNVEAVREQFPQVILNLVLFDLVYDDLIGHLPLIAQELKDRNELTLASMRGLTDAVWETATQAFGEIFPGSEKAVDRERFFAWLEGLIGRRDGEKLMRQISEWKRLAFPRVSVALFGVVSYYFSNLLPSFLAAQRGGKFGGKISPRNIGIKDFWNRLNQSYLDLLIQNLLADYKQRNPITPKQILDRFFTRFRPRHDQLITSNPVNFPGYRQSIDRSLDRGIPPVGVITGLADFEYNGLSSTVGVVVSNTEFQAGAFDMASGEKVCKLMAECYIRKLPLVMFISSGGMQTKEGAGALFSMAVINDRLTRFVKDADLPVIVFGYRDCTGGAQASFVTHRLVKTFYLSGCVMPFAGQRVVPSHLPVQAILSNYLSPIEGGMEGLVVNEFDEGLEERLRQIDPNIPVPTETIPQAIARVLTGEYRPSEAAAEDLKGDAIRFEPVRRVLIHARGATAARLVQGAHAFGAEVVLVQSDADMESYPTTLLGPKDRLVSLGGNTPQESYLNGMSVVRVAEMEDVDAIHPGIGFLSENANFAQLCRQHGFNLIGPGPLAMELMGNKSNAIATARRLNVAVVPGSQGVLTEAVYGKQIADEIGYPVLIKAAFGGGGKGMRVVYDAAQFERDFGRTSQEAFSAFGNGDVYLEKFVESMRHIEVQVLRDGHGHTAILGLRDCSVQRNNQKLVEESGSTVLPVARMDEVFEYARRISDDIDYVGAGTIEFIYDRKAEAVYFMEMNTRLQVEHPVTEQVCGIDIVVQQFRVASGESIAQLHPGSDGYAMEVRINAEQMELNEQGGISFVPAPGTVTRVELPDHSKIRVITAVGSGNTVPPFYDSLIVQIIAHDRDRASTIRTLREYLDTIVVEGIPTNIAMMEAVLDDPVFQGGDYDTGFLNGFYERIDAPALIERMEKRSGAAGAAINKEAIRIEGSPELKVLAPRTGVFYGSPTPDDPPFVELGAVIDTSQTLCLLEAMKVFESVALKDFNRGNGMLFDTDQRFKLNRVLAESGQTVNQGDLLFIVEPVPS